MSKKTEKILIVILAIIFGVLLAITISNSIIGCEPEKSRYTRVVEAIEKITSEEEKQTKIMEREK